MFDFSQNEKLKLPFSRHLEWMLLVGTEETKILSFYDSVQIAEPSRDHLADAEERISKLILPPSTKQYLRRKIFREVDLAVWKKHGYEDFYSFYTEQKKAKQEWSDLGKVLSHPVMRIALDCCIMIGLDAEEISAMMPQQFNIPISEDTVKLYQKNMFDVNLMTKESWKSFLRLLTNDSYSYNRYYAALTRPQAEVLHLVGLPSKNQFSDFLRNVLATADFKFRHYSRHNTPEANAEAAKWAKLGMDAGVKYEKFSAGDANDFSKLVQTQFEYDEMHIGMVTPEMIGAPVVSASGTSSGPTAAEEKAPTIPTPEETKNIFYG